MAELDALLINPISARALPAFLPHGLLYIASYAEAAGYRIKIYDRNVDEQPVEEIVAKYRPRVAGIGCLTGPPINDAILVSQRIRNIDRSIKIVWGGIHPTLYPDSVLSQDYVDFVVVGDGEPAFCGILDNLISKSRGLESIDNIGYKQAGEFRYNKSSFTDLDAIPQPAWHLIDVENYIRRKFYAKRVLTINTSRGCPYKCTFCCVPRVHKGKWRGIPATKIIENLRFLKKSHKIDGFQVDDEEFDIDRDRVLEICDLLEAHKLNFKWSHFSRINVIKEDVLRREISCGLKLIEFGVESGSEKMLNFLKKNQTVKQIRRAYELCRKLKIKTSALFMVGLPTEKEDDLNQTVKLIRRLNPRLTICTIYRPYPGTELFDFCINKGLFKYPDRLDQVGAGYSGFINTSNISENLIFKIKRHFDRNNIYQEVRTIIVGVKLGLLFYYLLNYIIKPAFRIKKRNCAVKDE